MIPVRTLPRYKCDFCKKRSTKSVIAKHETRCYRNPNRFCDNCQNKGYTTETENECEFKVPCHYCSKFDQKMLNEIEERENKNSPKDGDSQEVNEEVPF